MPVAFPPTTPSSCPYRRCESQSTPYYPYCPYPSPSLNCVRSSVVNVVWPWKGQRPNSALGVYKIAISDVRGLRQITQCLPYNLSAIQMASALNALPLIAARGGVTVRRYGNQSDVASSYGFTYRIEVDAVSTALFAAGRLTAAIQCYGMQCGDCYETEVAFEPAHAPYCLTGANFSTTNPNTCVMTPSLSVTALSVQSYCNYTGKGTLELTSSRHRLPPITTSTIAVSSGIGVVAADVVEWSKFQGVSEGILVVAGAGWEGWQSSSLLYAPSWTLDRGLVSVLLQAPTCVISITTFTVQDNAAVLTSAPSSNFTVQSLQWAGGVIGGLGTTSVQSSLVMSGASKFLSYGMHLVLAASASADWGQGNFYLGNGANVTVLGDWRISNYGAKITVYQAPQSADAALLNPFEDTQGRSWGSYYSDALTSELRPGWYLNPLCGDYCLTSSQMTFGGKGNLSTSTSANVSFYLPLNMIDESTIKVGDYADVSLHNGGTLGNEVVVDLSPGAVIHLTGGSLNMEARSTITGAGDLVVDAGAHNLAFSINAHITISNVSHYPFPLCSELTCVCMFVGFADLADKSRSESDHHLLWRPYDQWHRQSAGRALRHHHRHLQGGLSQGPSRHPVPFNWHRTAALALRRVRRTRHLSPRKHDVTQLLHLGRVRHLLSSSPFSIADVLCV